MYAAGRSLSPPNSALQRAVQQLSGRYQGRPLSSSPPARQRPADTSSPSKSRRAVRSRSPDANPRPRSGSPGRRSRSPERSATHAPAREPSPPSRRPAAASPRSPTIRQESFWPAQPPLCECCCAGALAGCSGRRADGAPVGAAHDSWLGPLSSHALGWALQQLGTEPVAVLRDVLNLPGARDARHGRWAAQGPGPPTGAANTVTGALGEGRVIVAAPVPAYCLFCYVMLC
jgi:hypothetical protein